jgi:hypothetical protein
VEKVLMKKFFLVVLFSFFINHLYSQQFQGGLFIGLTTTQVSGDQLSGFNKTGFLAGCNVSLPLGKNFDLALEMMYIQKGSRRKPKPDQGDDTAYVMKVNYVEVPIMLSYTYHKRIKFEAGPAFGRLVFSSEEDQYGEIPDRIQDRNPFKKYEFSVYAGLSYRFYKGWYVHTRLGTSVFPIRDFTYGQNYFFNRGQYNTVLFFSVRYLFSLGKNKIND